MSNALQLPELSSQHASAYARYNRNLQLHAALTAGLVKDRDLLTPPGSPAESDVYIMPAGTLTGDWATYAEDDLAIYAAGEWQSITPVGGHFIYILDEDIIAYYDTVGTAWTTISAGGGGESNTASNIGTGGVGVFKNKVGVDLRFKKINAGSGAILITDDTGNDEVDIDIPDNGVSYAKMQNVSATDKVLGRSTTGAGDPEEIACTAAGRALIDDADAAAQRTTLGLGTMATQAASAVAITGGTATGTRVNPRSNTQTSTTSLTPALANYDVEIISALAANLTINNPTGTPVAGQKLLLRVKDNGTTRTLTWGSEYRGIGFTLPAATTTSQTLYLGCIYNVEDTKWDVVAKAETA